MDINESAPSLAVVIPNKDDSAYLAACLNSVIRQSSKVDQIVFVDDASSDDSLDLAKRALGNIAGASVHANAQSLGTMGALNVGLEHVTCEYVLFLASNDFLAEGLVERAKASIAKLGRPGIWSAMVWLADENGNCKYVYPSPVVSLQETHFGPNECIRLAFRLGNWFTGTTMFFHRETLQRIGGFDVEYRGLADLFAALTVASLRGAIFCPRPFGVMRVHAGGYLWRTLTDHAHLEALLRRLAQRGSVLSPALFTSHFAAITARRIRFAAVRALPPRDWPREESIWQQGVYGVLSEMRVGCIPPGLYSALAFLLLRPFDIWPTLWYRLILQAWLSLRHKPTPPIHERQLRTNRIAAKRHRT